MTLEDIAFQPSDLIPNVVFSPEGGTLNADEAKKLGDADRILSGPPELLCRACGWTTYNELTSSYLPRLRMFHSRQDSGLWRMGNDWLIWDQPGDKGIKTNDYMTYKFLRDNGTKDIPLVEEMHQFGKEGDPFVFTVVSRAKGVRLESIWTTLSASEKRSYADQMVAALRELRQFTAPAPQRVDGSPLHDCIVAQCWPPNLCKTIPATKGAWLKNVDEELRLGVRRQLKSTHRADKPTPEALFAEIHATFPESSSGDGGGDGPFVLTHADLNMSNIIVSPSSSPPRILAIIDWEYAGYYPWWVERYFSYRRALSPNARELFNMVWAQLSPELPLADFVEQVYVPVGKARDACASAGVEHKRSHDVWLRPRWCECKAFGGTCVAKDLLKRGELEHEIDYEVDSVEKRFGNPMKRFDREVALGREDEVIRAEVQSLGEGLDKVQL